MSLKKLLKENFVLATGLLLPVLLVVGFMIASRMPQTLSEPPKYDLLFSVQDYTSNNNLPVSLNFIVKDGTLKAQYMRLNPPANYASWKKLYIYDSKKQTIKELPFGFPADMSKINPQLEETVAATKHMKLNTDLKAPDGYELAYDSYSHGGIMTGFFWGGGYSNEPRLRKGASSIRLNHGERNPAFYSGNVQFIGWVVSHGE